MRLLVSSSCLLALTFLFTCGTAPEESAPPPPVQGVASPMTKENRDWRVYTAPDRSFSVELPCEPMRTNVSEPETPVYQYSCGGEETSGFFLMDVMDLSDSERVKLREAAAFERSIRESFSPNKRVVKMTAINVDGGMGRDIIVHNTKNEEDLSRGRVIVIGARHYQIAFVSSDAKALESPAVERFFATFKPM